LKYVISNQDKALIAGFRKFLSLYKIKLHIICKFHIKKNIKDNIKKNDRLKLSIFNLLECSNIDIINNYWNIIKNNNFYKKEKEALNNF